MKKRQNGTQSIQRAFNILRLITLHNQQGLSLSEVIEESELHRSTAHRLLKSLIDENFIYLNKKSKKYHLGIDAMQIGFSSMNNIPINESLHPLVMRLSRLSEDTVFLVIQQGDNVLCLLREHGSFPVKIFSIDVGEKRLLGMGAGGLALLAKQNEEDLYTLYQRNQKAYDGFGITLHYLLEKRQETINQGYSFINSTITPGIAGVGYAFRVSPITTIAISFGTIESRLQAERKKILGELLINECNAWLDQYNTVLE